MTLSVASNCTPRSGLSPFPAWLPFNQTLWWGIVSLQLWPTCWMGGTDYCCRINSRIQVQRSWKVLVCKGIRWCYLSRIFFTLCLLIFLASSTYLWRNSRTINGGCKADSLSPRNHKDSRILIYIGMEEGSDLVFLTVNAGALQLREASTYKWLPEAGE